MNFIPYGKQSINQSDIDAVVEVLHSDYLTTGSKIGEFEDAIASYCGAKYCVAVANGTGALHLASLALLKEGDMVLTTPNSFLATSNSILYAKAEPIFVDITEDGNIDLNLCENYLTKSSFIKAIYGVSFSGNMLNQEKLGYLKEKYNIIILEDNAHAIGAEYNGIKAGSCINSDLSIFSFHPVKHLTTGEGGAVTTNSKEIYKKLLMLRNHGMVKSQTMKPWEYEMRELGFNYRITDIQSALGISQLKRLDSFIKKRVEIAKRYDEVFKDTLVKPLYLYNGKSSYHLYVVRVDFTQLNISKEQLFIKMREKNIGLQLHYIPINRQPFYRDLGYGDEYTPNMDRYYQESFSLPIYFNLSSSEQEYIIESLFEVLNG
jgi:UDP-4-amino-4,6-dideoxy-N-acetyl-beta-L-altrosamine transaminase